MFVFFLEGRKIEFSARMCVAYRQGFSDYVLETITVPLVYYAICNIM